MPMGTTDNWGMQDQEVSIKMQLYSDKMDKADIRRHTMFAQRQAGGYESRLELEAVLQEKYQRTEKHQLDMMGKVIMKHH